MCLGVFQLGLILEAVDLAEDGAFTQFECGLRQVGLSLLHVRTAFFRIRTVLGYALIHLMLEVFVFSLGFPGIVHFLGAIEFSQHVPGLHLRSAGNELGQRHISALALGLRHSYGQSVDGLDGPVRTDHTL